MKLEGTMLVTKNIKKSVRFYQEVLYCTILLDLGTYVVFEGGFCLITEEQYQELYGVSDIPFTYGNQVSQLGFEDDDIDAFMVHLKKFQDISIITPLREYPWGQRSIRFQDPDGHLMEVGENMKVVVKRFLLAGMSVEETMKKSMFPREFIEMCSQELTSEGAS